MAWTSFATASPIDPDAFLFMGADPCWSPTRETKAPDSDDAPAGRCSLCGGDGEPVGLLVWPCGNPVLDDDGQPIVASARAIEPGSHRVCARCQRSGRDPKSRPAAGLPEPSPEAGLPVASDPGYVTRNGVTVPERFSRLMKG